MKELKKIKADNLSTERSVIYSAFAFETICVTGYATRATVEQFSDGLRDRSSSPGWINNFELFVLSRLLPNGKRASVPERERGRVRS
jgi:hypothetical protein